MKLIYALLVLFSTTAFAALPSAVPSVTVSASGANTAQVSISPSMLSGAGVNGIFSLFGYVASSASNFSYPLTKNGTQYQVTAGKTAYCFDITASASSANSSFQLVSATAAMAYTGTANGSLTGGVFQGGTSTAYPVTAGPTARVASVVPGVYSFGASTYPGFATSAETTTYSIHMDCYEQ